MDNALSIRVLDSVSFGQQLYEILKIFANKAAEIHQCLLRLITDIDLLLSALQCTQKLLEKDADLQKQGQDQRLFSEKALKDTQRASNKCMLTFESVARLIQRKGGEKTVEVVLDNKHPDHLRLHQKTILLSLGRVDWDLVQDNVERLANRLLTLKLTLNLVALVVCVRAQVPDR